MLYQQMTAQEKIQHSLPQCPPEQMEEMVQKVEQVEQQAGTPIVDPKQIQKIYQEIAKLQTKKVDEAIKQISQQAQAEMQPQQNFGPIPQRLQQGQVQPQQNQMNPQMQSPAIQKQANFIPRSAITYGLVGGLTGGVSGGITGGLSKEDTLLGGAAKGALAGGILGTGMGVYGGHKTNKLSPHIKQNLTNVLKDKNDLGATLSLAFDPEYAQHFKKIIRLGNNTMLGSTILGTGMGNLKDGLKEKKAGIVNNLMHAAPHLNEVAGLGVLAVPSVQSLRGKHMNEKTKDMYEIGGLGMLAAPSAYHAGKSLFQKAAPIVSKLADFQEWDDGSETLKRAKKIDKDKCFTPIKTAGGVGMLAAPSAYHAGKSLFQKAAPIVSKLADFQEWDDGSEILKRAKTIDKDKCFTPIKTAGLGSFVSSLFKRPQQLASATPINKARAGMEATRDATNLSARARGMKVDPHFGAQNPEIQNTLIKQRMGLGNIEQGMTPEIMNQANQFQLQGGVKKLTDSYQDKLLNNPQFQKQMDQVALRDPSVNPMLKMQIEDLHNPVAKMPSQQTIRPPVDSSATSQTFLPKKVVPGPTFEDSPNSASTRSMRINPKSLGF
jgi:chorismate mutase